jgi:hypothetical protein
MSDGNWIVPEAPAYVLCNPPEKGSTTKGLLWGQGDPTLAVLHSYDYWAVVRVQSYYETENEGRRCVEFKEGETVFEGARTEAIKILIKLGADPARISVEVQIRDDPVKFRDGPYVRTGDCGTSIVPDYGIARAGLLGHAAAGEEGIAWAGMGGNAHVGVGGLAIVGGGGMATAGNGGTAIGSSGLNKLFVGRGGVAITGPSGRIWVGDRGIGISRRSGTVYGGSESIVIGEIVSGGAGSLLVARKLISDDGSTREWQVAYGIVGQDGIRPWAKYTVEDNRLIERSDAEIEEEVTDWRRKWLEALAAGAARRALDADRK